MRSLTLAMARTVDQRDRGEQTRWLQAQLDAARRLIAELERKLGERLAGEAGR